MSDAPQPTHAPLTEALAKTSTLPDALAKVHPKLARGMVWCTVCGRSEKVDAADCFRRGWPKCCGYAMTIDSPEERAALSAASTRADDAG